MRPYRMILSIELALARTGHAASGIQDKSQALMKSVVGSPNIANGDFFAAALRDDIQPDETMEDAKNIVDTVSEQVDSGEYEKLALPAWTPPCISWRWSGQGSAGPNI